MLPNEFKFEHGSGDNCHLYHAKRVADYYVVSWYEADGHDEGGSVNWKPREVERWVNEGAWRILEDKAPHEFYDAYELDDLPQNTPVKVVKAYRTFEVGQIIYRNKERNVDDVTSCKFSEKPDGGGERWLMTCEEVAKADTTDILSAGVNGERLRASIERHQAGEAVEDNGNIAGELGVYRPELETRKVGKVRVELVDDGFPLALREIAKVMTWAQSAKGYKDHDWQNLPNAEQALAAAASRHRTDHIKQRIVDGEAITDCVDSESNLLHKAHEAFGVLAQLELMLRGEFDK